MTGAPRFPKFPCKGIAYLATATAKTRMTFIVSLINDVRYKENKNKNKNKNKRKERGKKEKEKK
jgi:hypothetical protein